MSELLGYDRAELLSMSVGDFSAGEPVPVEVSLRHIRIDGREQVLAIVRDIRERKEREARITEESLTLVRQGETVPDPEPIGMDDRVHEWWTLVETGGAELTVEEPFVVHGDPDRLRQAFENLVRNAVEHGSTGSRAQSPSGGARVEFRGADVEVEAE